MSYHVESNGNDIIIRGVRDFSLAQTFDCGQCFRFTINCENHVEGIAFGRHIEMYQPDPETIQLIDCSIEDYENIWRNFLSLDDDYSAIKEQISERFKKCSNDPDEIINKAMDLGGGIRILKQDKWESLCSFIISQNNNIPRIMKIIREMSEKYGETVCYYKDGKACTEYAFPTAKALYEAGEEAIFQLKTGFRAKYIYNAAKAVYLNEISLDEVYTMPGDAAAAELMKLKGVGPKVAACALLFGFGKTDAFPIDVWMKRIIARYYPGGLNVKALGEYAGIAQQYLFYYVRYINPELT